MNNDATATTKQAGGIAITPALACVGAAIVAGEPGEVIPIVMTHEQWNFIALGLRDLRDYWIEKAVPGDINGQCNAELSKENAELAAYIDKCCAEARDATDTSYWDDMRDTLHNISPVG